MDIYLYLACSFIFSALGAWLIYRWGNSFGLLDRSNKRSSHEGVIPKGGGIGILTAFIFISLFLEMPLAYWLPTIVLALFSLLGDRIEISPKIRLPIQFIAAIVFLIFSYPSLLTHHPLPIIIFFAIFIVATANWYNFMDGINGIAAITGIVAFCLLAAFNILSGRDSHFSVLSICIALSCLGFLPFNMPKARVFLGDVGSILLGFVFAAIVVMISKSFLDFVCLTGFLFPFYADEFVTMAVRIRDGENLLKAHRRHFYQLLANEMGIDHWKVSIGYGILQFVVGVSVLLIRPFGILPILTLLFVFFSAFIWVNYIVRMEIQKRGNRK
jgi:UDP-N-acetylmuramyl pentapeptide phosphotransferase/UDP-N-acetylglucosamine-1-phosphate transferase